ncbi:MAG TPA: zf-HC2 domain-containing protein [Bryobacteraceae bacterium]|nr:zf-HC2 domain-containing protein [Bryobacteraceae bacterium]
MEHDHALKTQAVDRYLLGEMPADERQEFEEHYFICAECGRDVREGARFRANAREVLRDPRHFQAVEDRSSRFWWWRLPSMAPVAASLLLLGVVVYQAGFEIPSLKHQARLPVEGAVSFTLRDTTRGANGAQIVQIPHTSGLVSLHFDILTDEKTPWYECSITSASGSVMGVTKVAAPTGDEPAVIHVRPDFFNPGRYNIAVRGVPAGGNPGKSISNFEFEIN